MVGVFQNGDDMNVTRIMKGGRSVFDERFVSIFKMSSNESAIHADGGLALFVFGR